MREELSCSTFFNIGPKGECESEHKRGLYIEGFEFADLFREGEPVWYVVKRLPEYVASVFKSGRVRCISLWYRFCLRLRGVYCDGSKIAIGKGTKIYPGAYIADNVIIGRNCVIGQNAVLRGPLILGDGCKVGPSGEVSASVFLPGAIAAHKNYVGNSIVGCGVNLGAGAETANVKLNESEISFIGPRGRVFTGLRKFGAIIGDGCSIGCNAVLNPGTLLGKGCLVGALVSVSSRQYPEGSRVRRAIS